MKRPNNACISGGSTLIDSLANTILIGFHAQLWNRYTANVKFDSSNTTGLGFKRARYSQAALKIATAMLIKWEPSQVGQYKAICPKYWYRMAAVKNSSNSSGISFFSNI